jgi:acyl-CoA thioesterase
VYFDEETTATADGDRLLIHVSPAWNISGTPNGGFLNSIVLRSMRDVAAHPDPMSVTTHFYRPTTSGTEAEVQVELVRSGRTTSATSGALVQDGKDRLRTTAIFGELTGSDVLAGPHLDLSPPPIPEPEECVRREGQAQGVDLPIRDRLDIRLHPDQAPSDDLDVAPLGRAEITGWIRFTHEEPVDTLALCLFADGYPPPLLNLLGRIGWVPTIELTVHVRRRPVPGWILGRFTVHDLVDGHFVEDGVLWDESGSVVAQSRQLGLLLGTGTGDGA